jgi:hypothetical protein
MDEVVQVASNARISRQWISGVADAASKRNRHVCWGLQCILELLLNGQSVTTVRTCLSTFKD